MALAELLPAVRALTRDEKLKLVSVVTDELAKDDPLWWFKPGQEYDTGPGLHDAHEAGAILFQAVQRDETEQGGSCHRRSGCELVLARRSR